MESRDFETIDQFLKLVEKSDLFEYYALATDAGEDLIEESIKKRRSWAQGQQSNPKYRGEALWVIKNMTLIRRALVATGGGVIVPGGIAAFYALRRRAARGAAQRLGISRERASERIASMADGAGGPRGPDLGPAPESFVDYYQTLRVPADATTAEIEEAHRARYREARDLADKGRASEAYALLDEAWRTLRDPERRGAYDSRRGDYMSELERRATGEDAEFKGFLPPPKRKPLRQADAPRAPEPPRHVEAAPEPEPVEVVLTQASRVVNEAPPPRPTRPVTTSPPRSQPAPPPPQLPRPAGVTSPGLSTYSTGHAAPPQVHPSSARPAPTPPAPPAVTDPALAGGYGAARQRQRAPQLEIDGKEVHKVRTSNNPVAVQFVVRNAGQGQMSGRVLSDREWVVVSPARLDPSKREQVIEAVVHPAQMPRRQAISLVTVVADHGERRSVTIDVERQVLPVAAYVAIAAISLLVIIVIAVLVF